MSISLPTSKLIELALTEDIGSGDVTSLFFVKENLETTAYIFAKQEGRVAGMEVCQEVFRRVDSTLKLLESAQDGDALKDGDRVLTIQGKARSILTAERTALNFLQRLSGVATLTSLYVNEVKDSKVRLLDTRKTTPGWRELQKAAVRAGGGYNHRMGLYDRAMIKDNHLLAAQNFEELQHSIDLLKSQHPSIEVEIEVDTLQQLALLLNLKGVDYFLLDNMSLDALSQAVRMRDAHDSSPLLEASGGICLETLKAIGETGVDFISVGALTHSAIALDFSLAFQDPSL